MKICSVCNKQFKTKAALQQHTMTVHQSKRAVAKKGSKKLQRTNRLVTSGVDLISTFPLISGWTIGTVVFRRQLTPLQMGDTRFQQEAELWSRWRPLKLKMHVDVFGTAFCSGGLAVTWVADPTAELPTANAVPAYMLSLPTHQQVGLTGRSTFDVPVESARKWYQTTGDTDQTSHGVVLCAVVANLGGFAGSISGNVTFEWQVEWDMAEPPQQAVRPYGDVIKPDDGNVKLFTTSDGSFDSERLTFKTASGGDMTPFNRARDNVVYTPLDDNVKVYYVDETKATKQCKYFARVQGYKIPGLLLFATYKDAEDYIRTGDVTKALKYTSASTYAVPDVPVFKPAVAPVTNDAALNDRLSDIERKLSLLMDQLTMKNISHDPNMADLTLQNHNELLNIARSTKNTQARLQKTLGIKIAEGHGSAVYNPLPVSVIIPVKPDDPKSDGSDIDYCESN